LLTHTDEEGHLRPKLPGRTLTALARGLRSTLPRLSGETPPTLVLMGDALDLGLSSGREVSWAYLRFIDELFPPGVPELFAKQVIFLPGNHDHHLWRVAQDGLFLEEIAALPEADYQRDTIKRTLLLEPPRLTCELLTRLMRTRPHLAEAEVKIAYPNLGLVDREASRAVVLHHGHYIDAMYRAVSRLRTWLTGGTEGPVSVAQIEAENGPWVDFLWSDLGGAGALGHAATSLYETMLDAGAAHRFADLVAGRILAAGRPYGIASDTPLWRGVTAGGLASGLIELTLGRAAESQRNGFATVMNAQEIADLRWYLGGPVVREFQECAMAELPDDLTFVFGHTHKPFQDQLQVDGWKKPVTIFNTGGWVMDQPTLMPLQGGAIVLVDDALNVASLRLFNDPLNGEMPPVRAEGAGGFHDRTNPLLAQLEAALALDKADWGAFSAEAEAAIMKRSGIRLDRALDAQAEARP
jgi:hypothetical protein